MPEIKIGVSDEEYELWAIGTRLTEIRNEQKLLNNRRKELVLALAEAGHNQGHIALIAGITSGRVSQIVTGYHNK